MALAMTQTQRPMIRIKLQVDLAYSVNGPGGDFIFNFHAAHTANQTVLDETLSVTQGLGPGAPVVPSHLSTDPTTGTRCLRLHAPAGPLNLAYAATVDMRHDMADPLQIPEVSVRDLPDDVLPYLYPSRYCQSDQLSTVAFKEFGHLWQGYNRVLAIRDWVHGHVEFRSNTSTSTTSALDTFVQRMGVCRDFAHLMIAMCRALNIPARCVTGTDYGADPVLGPPDFHAYVEVYLGGRWYLFDPSGTAIPMGMIRMATGRDAADVAFATIFGNVGTEAPKIVAWAVQDPGRGFELPQHSSLALSTDGHSPERGLRHAY